MVKKRQEFLAIYRACLTLIEIIKNDFSIVLLNEIE